MLGRAKARSNTKNKVVDNEEKEEEEGEGRGRNGECESTILDEEVGNALWLSHFTPVRLDNLHFVNRLLETFCALDICCAITGTYPAYIAGVLNSYFRTRPAVGGLQIARTNTPILGTIYSKRHTFDIVAFEFRLTEWLEYENIPDYSIYDITHEGMTVTDHFTTVDVPVHCGSHSNINLAEFIWCQNVRYSLCSSRHTYCLLPKLSLGY